MSRPLPEVAYLFRDGELVLPPESALEHKGEGAIEGVRLPGSEAAWRPGILELSGPAATRIFRGPTGRVCGATRLTDGAESALSLPSPLRGLPFRSALANLPAHEAAEAAKGLALLNWLDVARHCGACGEKLVDDLNEAWESGARKCPACGRLFFPRVSPAVIILVRRGDKALFAHNASFPAGRFGLIAGFVEPGETFEETARRELLEEASIEVSSLRYVSSQPWPFPDSLMVAFEADWAAGEGMPDGKEITELLWRGPDELPSIPPPGSVARALIDRFVRDGRIGAAVS